jgi:RluA family pseudouridine synthase
MRLSTASADAGKRLDQYLREQMPDVSRSRIQDWIRQSRVLVNGEQPRASYAVRSGDLIDVEPAAPPPSTPSPEQIPLTILYEDEDVVAIDKPAGMVVHAGAGVAEGTLVNALLARYEALSSVGGVARPGIVHRLDRYTSGVLLVARNDAAHHALAAQFSSRKVEKIYLALVHGAVKTETGRIEKPIARDPVRRIRMTTRLKQGRAAWTEYRGGRHAVRRAGQPPRSSAAGPLFPACQSHPLSPAFYRRRDRAGISPAARIAGVACEAPVTSIQTSAHAFADSRARRAPALPKAPYWVAGRWMNY